MRTHHGNGIVVLNVVYARTAEEHHTFKKAMLLTRLRRRMCFVRIFHYVCGWQFQSYLNIPRQGVSGDSLGVGLTRDATGNEQRLWAAGKSGEFAMVQ